MSLGLDFKIARACEPVLTLGQDVISTALQLSPTKVIKSHEDSLCTGTAQT